MGEKVGEVSSPTVPGLVAMGRLWHSLSVVHRAFIINVSYNIICHSQQLCQVRLSAWIINEDAESLGYSPFLVPK